MKWIFLQFSFVFAVVVLVRGEIDQEWIKKTLHLHFSQPRNHVTYAKYKKQAMEFIRDQFREYGLETHIDIFPTLVNQVNGVNIIGILKGKNFNTPHDSIVGVGAHYDTMRDSSGVDDNGAAVVAMLQAAKETMNQPDRNNTVIFAAFDFEEWEEGNLPNIACGDIGCGSSHFIKGWVPFFWSSFPSVAGVMIMDSIMNFDENKLSQKLPIKPSLMKQLFPIAANNIEKDNGQGDFLAAIGRPADAYVLDTFVNQFLLQGQTKYEIEKFNLSMIRGNKLSYREFLDYNNFMRSDHASFWMAGIPAVFLTDTANFRGYMENCYHKSCDNMERVTDAMIGFVAKTSKALAATVNKMAPPLPGSTNSGQQMFPEVFLLLSVILAIQKLTK